MATTSLVFVATVIGVMCIFATASPGAAPGASLPASRPASRPATGPELGEAKDVEFKGAGDGTPQKYILRLPGDFDADRPHDVMIALHGHGSDRRQYSSDPRGECKGARDVAAQYAMIFVSPDYRASTSWMGPDAEADVVQIIADLKKQYKVGKVLLVGASMGGTAALTFTALHPDLIDGVVSANGMANLLEYDVDGYGIQDAIKDSFGGRKDETPAQYKKRNAAEYIKRSAEPHPEKFTMPIAFTLGGKDTLVPPQSALRLAKAIQKHNRRVLVIHHESTGHETSYADTVESLTFVIDAMRSAPTASTHPQ